MGLKGRFLIEMQILARCLPLEERPKWTGAMGGSVGVAQIIAPTLGGMYSTLLFQQLLTSTRHIHRQGHME